MKLSIAHLMYGSSIYPVESREDIPLPQTFDAENPVECAKKIFAMMSNASGGHTIRRCKLQLNLKIGSANLVGTGVHVYYATGIKLSLPVDELMKIINDHTQTFELGDVVTDQYGDGWKRAVWS